MPTLLVLALGLWVVGVILALVGSYLKAREQRSLEAPSWSELIRSALGEMLKGIAKIVKGPSLGDRLIGAGSLCLYAGFVVLVGWLASEVVPGLGSSASASPPA